MTYRVGETGWPIVVAVVVFIVAMNLLLPGDLSNSGSFIASGIYVWGIGLLFLLAYYFEHKSVVFRALIWFCEHLTFPPGRKMAFFYFALASILGTIAILQGLGVINVVRNP